MIELFTSQGCSSCPPPEAWMSEFVHDPRLWREIIPVAFHVDYWTTSAGTIPGPIPLIRRVKHVIGTTATSD